MDLKKLSLLPKEISGAENIRLRKPLSKGTRNLFIVDFGLKDGHLRSSQLNINFKSKMERFLVGMVNIGKMKHFFTIRRLVSRIEDGKIVWATNLSADQHAADSCFYRLNSIPKRISK
jgi:hypothetical protein